MTPASTDLTRALVSHGQQISSATDHVERISRTRRARSVASAIVATLERTWLPRNATLQIERLCQEFCRARSSLDRGRTPCKRHRMDTLHAPGARTPFGHGAGARVWQGRRQRKRAGRGRRGVSHFIHRGCLKLGSQCSLRCFVSNQVMCTI